MTTINIVTLGELRCLKNGAETGLPLQKRRFSLLAYLALERSAPRARVVALFYPEIDEVPARRRLTQSIYAIRQDLGVDCIQTWGGELRASEELISDARQFGDLAERGEYARAFELYRRPFLDGFYLSGTAEWERWVDRRRAVLARTFVQTARLLINTLIEQGSFAPAAAYAARWIELDDDCEEAHRLFMTALTRAGRFNDALRHYLDWERDLLANDGEIPSVPMTAFKESLRRSVENIRVRPLEIVRDEPRGVRPAVAPLPTGSEQTTSSNEHDTLANLRSAFRRYLNRHTAAL